MRKWLEISVHVASEWVETVSFFLREIGAGGVVIDDPAVIRSLGGEEPELRPESMPPHHLPIVKAYFPVSHGKIKLQILKTMLIKAGFTGFNIETSELEEDWLNAWRAYYKTQKIGKKIVIKPTWEEYTHQDGNIVIDMDPGMAFGSGTHATTILCLSMLEDYVKTGDTILDVGTGSGILAIAAARLGATGVIAVDNDPVAVDTARKNVLRNKVESIVNVYKGNLLNGIDIKASGIVANIVSSAIIDLFPYAAELLEKGGYFIASGIIKDRLEEVRDAVKKAGFVVDKTYSQGEWVVLVAIKI